jgi:hypothetical protein
MEKRKIISTVICVLAIGCATYGADVYVNAAATAGANNGTSWANAYLDLQSAMPGTGNIIHVAEGVYKPGTTHLNNYAPGSNVTLLGGYSKTNPGLMARDPKTFRTILNADVNGDDVIYDFINDTSLSEVSDMTMENALMTGNRMDNIDQLIRLSVVHDVTIDGLVFIGGTPRSTSVYSGGGGIYMNGSGAGTQTYNITVSNCEFLRNYAAESENGGAGIYIYGYTHDITINDCYFADNGTRNQRPCALAATSRDPCDNVTINRCIFARNYNLGDALKGGVIGSDYKMGRMTLNDCLFIENGCNPLYSGSYGVLMSRVQQSGNLSMIVNNCVFIGNRTLYGGAITVLSLPNAVGGGCTLNIRNCLVANNTAGASGFGAGIFIRNTSSTTPPGPMAVSIINNTVADNTDALASYPGIYVAHSASPNLNPNTLTINNSILWGNKGAKGNASFGGWNAALAGSLTMNYNCLDNTDPNNYVPPGTVGNLYVNPQFAAGDVKYHLAASSPCIDAGDPADPVGSEPKCNGDRINMGAYGGMIYETPTVNGANTDAGDVNCDGNVDLADFSKLASQWLQ